MKSLSKHIIILLIALISASGISQETKGYRIEGDEIIFIFDKHDYDQLREDNWGTIINLNDFEIENVAVAGSFNKWSMDKWKMSKVSDHRYELRKKIDDFNDQFQWEFKFVINDDFWAEPDDRFPNTTEAYDLFGNPMHAYNLRLDLMKNDPNGNTSFFLEGFEDANQVILAGSFNKWNEESLQMIKVDKGWKITLDLPPGIYQYRYIVDGEWIEDPTNSDRTLNEFGGYNSIKRVKKEVVFKLKNFQHATEVILTGSFNNWDEKQLKMTKTGKGWIQTMILPGGKHHYKFIIDGEWMVDPDNSVMEYDGAGNINSVCMVK